jgi:hypothetical protein
MKKQNCNHIIGQYYHSNSELQDFCYASEMDGLGEVATFWNFCPLCGVELTKNIIKKAMSK